MAAGFGAFGVAELIPSSETHDGFYWRRVSKLNSAGKRENGVENYQRIFKRNQAIIPLFANINSALFVTRNE